jgi:hypothetical protein
VKYREHFAFSAVAHTSRVNPNSALSGANTDSGVSQSCLPVPNFVLKSAIPQRYSQETGFRIKKSLRRASDRAWIGPMRRRSFLSKLATVAAGFSILPSALTYDRQWKFAESGLVLPDDLEAVLVVKWDRLGHPDPIKVGKFITEIRYTLDKGVWRKQVIAHEHQPA